MGPLRKRGRPRKLNPSEAQRAAAWIEANLPPGTELVHTRRMGWLLRRWDSWMSPAGAPRDGWREVDSAPDGQLAALLIRVRSQA